MNKKQTKGNAMLARIKMASIPQRPSNLSWKSMVRDIKRLRAANTKKLYG